MPEPRSGYAAGVLDGQLIIAGGTYWEGTKGNWTKKVFTPVTHAFDPVKEKWNKLPDAPTPIGYSAATVIKNKLFVLGGYTGRKINSDIYTLEKHSDKYIWKDFGPMPASRLFAVAVSVGSSIYLLGGTERFEPYDESGTCCTSKSAVNTLLTLDTAAAKPQWRPLSPFPGSQRWLFAFETDGESLWMFGGAYQEKVSDPIVRIPETWRYRIAQDKWEQIGSVPAAAIEGSPLVPVFSRDSLLLVSFKKAVWRFDRSSYVWTEMIPLPEEAFVDKFCVVNGQIVGSGGENKLDGPRRRSEWTFIGRIIASEKK